MNQTSINYSSFAREIILYRANEDTFRKLVPTISFYSALAILGVAGNLLAIYIFMTQLLKNHQNELFILLSVLVACGVCLPLDILDMRNMFLYPSTVLCKTARFLNMFTMMSSVLTLCALAIFRWRAVSSGAVFSPTRTRRLAGLGFLVLVSASVSWIAAVVFGIRSSPTFIGGITGRDCSIADATSRTAWPIVFNLVLGIGFASLLTVTTTAYFRIWRVVRKSRMAVTAYTKSIHVSPRVTLERKVDVSRCEDNNVNVSPSDTGQRKTDLSGTKEPDDINERKTYFSRYEDKNVNDSPGDIEKKKTDLCPYNDHNETNKISASRNKNKQSTQPSTTLILAEGSIDIAIRNDALTDGRSTDCLTPTKNNALLDVDSIVKIHTSDGSRFVNDSNANSISTSLSVASSDMCNAVNKDNVTSRMEQNSKRKHCRDILDVNFTGDIWRMTDSSKAHHILHNKTPTSNLKPPTTNTGNNHNRHSTTINSITKDDLSMDLTTTASTQRTTAGKPGETTHELKRKLSKTSLEAAITRTAFLLTLTFVVSYLPFFFVSIPRVIHRDTDYSQDALKANLVNTAIRLYFIMPAVSPAIFWASNLDFRRKCKALCSKNSSFVV